MVKIFSTDFLEDDGTNLSPNAHTTLPLDTVRFASEISAELLSGRDAHGKYASGRRRSAPARKPDANSEFNDR